MTIAVAEQKIYWSAGVSQSQTVTTGGAASTSDTASFTSTVIDISIALKANNAGTPATGDTVDTYALYAIGDPDGSATAEYVTTGHGILLARLDTFTDNPAITVVRLNPNVQAMKLYTVNNGGRTAVVSATMLTKTGS